MYYIDYLMVDEELPNPNLVPTNIQRYCTASAFFSIFSEFLSFLYIACLSYMIKKRIFSSTSNFRKINIILHTISIIVAVVMILVAGIHFEFGLSVNKPFLSPNLVNAFVWHINWFWKHYGLTLQSVASVLDSLLSL